MAQDNGQDGRTRRRRWLVEGGVLLAYLASAIIYTFPLIARPLTHFPGGPQDKDVFTFIWGNWWTFHAVTALHVKPYFTDFVWAPFLVDLRLHALGLLYGLLCLPLMPLLGPVGVLNLQLLASAALNGYATFKLTGTVTRDDRAAFVAGLIVATIPAIDYHLNVGRTSYMALWPAIFAAHFFLRLLDQPTRRAAAFLAASLVAMLMADQQIAIYGTMWLVLLFVHAAVSRRRDLARAGRLLAGAVGAGVLAPGYLLYLRPLLRSTGYTVPGDDEAPHYSYPVSLLWSPGWMWAVYGTLAPLGLLAGLALVRRARAAAPWVLGSVAFLVLSFGPVVKGTSIPLPFALLHKLPGLAQFRTPYRFQTAAALGLAVTVGVVAAWLLPRLGGKARVTLLIGLVAAALGDTVVQRALSGFSTQTLARDAVYEEIGRDSRDVLLLEIPVGARTGTDRVGPLGEELTFHQPVHHKRLINGLIARAPLATLAYYRASPALMFLAGETPPPGDLGADLRRRMDELRVGYVVIHPDMLEPGRLPKVLELLAAIDGLSPLRSSTGLLAFRR